MRSGVFLLLLGLAFASDLTAEKAQNCRYINLKGELVYTESLRAVPRAFREHAACAKAPQPMPEPSALQLEGSVREETISTSLGKINIRWSRATQKLFGRSPMRAVADAARTTSKFINLSGFNKTIRDTQAYPWQIVFIHDKLPPDVPAYYVDNCHPGWMIPPAKIYIVASRAVAGCGENRPEKDRKVADSELTKLLLHEFGHVVEYRLLEKLKYQRQPERRLRAEGFASWFEQEAARYATTVDQEQLKAYYYNLARKAAASSPDRLYFRGSAYDYAYAAAYFQAIVERTSTSHLMDIYELIAEDNYSLFEAIDERLSWNRKRTQKETLKYLNLR